MKSYIKPLIKSIPLRKDSAILQVCHVGGAYFGWGGDVNSTKCCGVGTTGTALTACPIPVKGQSNATNNAAPSSFETQGSQIYKIISNYLSLFAYYNSI